MLALSYCPGVALPDEERPDEAHPDSAREAQATSAPILQGRRLRGEETHIETVHEKRRDHVCGYCKGVAFGRAGDLKAHISAIHLKIKRSRGAK